MPCFLSGISAARSVGATLGAPVYEFSHQNGHIMAALYSSDALELLDSGERFAAFHVSGGTTELLLVTPNEVGFDVELVGGSADMNAGQAIDRTGVLMGLKFPCGREMEQICRAAGNVPHAKTKISVKGLECNLSGLENLAAKLYEKTGDRAQVSAYCFDFIADTLCALTENLRSVYPDIPVIYAGGVMSNERIGEQLASLGNVRFAKPEFSSDNAAGIALLCRATHVRSKK